MAACARSAHSFDGPRPASGLDIRMAATPQVAMAHDGSWAITSRNAFSVSPYRNECSIATEVWKLGCTAGLHEFWKSTLPSCSLGWASPPLGTWSTRETSSPARTTCAFIDVGSLLSRGRLRGGATSLTECLGVTLNALMVAGDESRHLDSSVLIGEDGEVAVLEHPLHVNREVPPLALPCGGKVYVEVGRVLLRRQRDAPS